MQVIKRMVSPRGKRVSFEEPEERSRFLWVGAAVFAVVAVVFAAVAVVSAVSAAVALATAFAHHSFRPRNVTRVNAESLFKASDTCCKPMVIAMTD